MATKAEMDIYTENIEIANDRADVRKHQDKWYGLVEKKYKVELDKLPKVRKIKCVLYTKGVLF